MTMRTAIVVVLSLLLELVASAQQPSKVWTNRDLERPIQLPPHRHVTESEMEGIRARAFVATPVYEPGWSYVIPWTPEQDRPKMQRLPRASYNDYGRRYAEQTYYPSWLWYPQTRIVAPGHRQQLPRVRR
jgi:hypothetical protein